MAEHVAQELWEQKEAIAETASKQRRPGLTQGRRPVDDEALKRSEGIWPVERRVNRSPIKRLKLRKGEAEVTR